MSILFTISWL